MAYDGQRSFSARRGLSCLLWLTSSQVGTSSILSSSYRNATPMAAKSSPSSRLCFTRNRHFASVRLLVYVLTIEVVATRCWLLAACFCEINCAEGCDRGKSAVATGHGAYYRPVERDLFRYCSEGPTLHRPGGTSRQSVRK